MSDRVPVVVARGVVLQPGLDANGQPSGAVPWIEFGPGDTVILAADEAARLQQSGALVSTSMGFRRNIRPA